MEENKKESIFKKIENSVVLQIVFFVVSMAVIVGGYVGVSGHAKQVGTEKGIREAKVQDDYDILASVDEISVKDGEITLSGWAMRLDSVTKGIYLVLKEVDGTEQIVLETEALERKEIEEYFKPGWEFGEVGFETSVKEKKIKKDVCYEVFVYLNYEVEQENTEGVSVWVESGKKITGGKYLYNGQLFRYDPSGFVEPEFENAFMQEVVQQGELYFYGAEENMWIYEYQGSMYWIAGEEFMFDSDGQTYIPGHAYTTEFDKIPERMKDIGRFGYDFIFEEREITLGAETEQYRVATRTLQDDSIITWMRTGLYNPDSQEWIWQAFIPVMRRIEVIE